MSFIANILSYVKEAFSNWSTRKQLYILYVFFILLPFSVFLLYTIKSNNRKTEQEVLNAYLQTLVQIDHNLSYRLEAIETISLNLLRNPDLYTNLIDSGRDSLEQQIADTMELRKLAQEVQRNDDILRMRIFVKNNKIYTRDAINFFSFFELEKSPFAKEIIEGKGNVIWLDTYTQVYVDHKPVNIISCSRMIRNPNNFDEFIAALLLDVPEQNISDILSNIGNGMEQNIYLINSEGRILSHADKSLIGRMAEEVNEAVKNITGDKGIVGYEHGINRGYIIHCKQNTIGGSILLIIPASSIAQEARDRGPIWFITAFIIFVSLLIIATFIIMILYVKQIDKKTSELVMSMDSLCVHNNQLTGPVNLSMLETSVNALIKRTAELMGEVYQQKLKSKDMELRLLQAQINPHFLYNTIDTIYWTAIRYNAMEVAEMLSALAKYFRFSLNKGRDIVSVEDELELVHSYIRLQRARFPGRFFTFEYNIDESCKSLPMPKLTIQPIIENALIHGIYPLEGIGRISITIECREDDVYFQICDNGIGFDVDIELSKDSLRNGYGLYNVNQRLLLYNENGEGLHISSQKNKGTTVWFVIVKKHKPAQ